MSVDKVYALMDETDVEKARERTIDLSRSGKHEEALLLCRENVERWDKRFQHEAWDQLAYILWRCGQKDEAVEAISMAIELAPEDRSHRFSRARYALEVGDLAASKADWTKLLDLESDLSSTAFLGAALLGRALAFAGLNDRNAALEDLAKIGDDEVMLVGKRLWTAGDLREEMERRD